MDYTCIDIDKIHIQTPEYNEDLKIYEALTLYDDEQMIFITPELRVVRIIKHEGMYEFVVEFQADYPEFYDKVMKMDKRVINLINDNSKAWFNINTSLDMTEQLMKRTISLPETLLENPTMSFYVSSDIMTIDVSCVDESIETNVESIKRNDLITTVLTLCGVQFYPHKYIILLTGNIIQVVKRRDQPYTESEDESGDDGEYGEDGEDGEEEDEDDRDVRDIVEDNNLGYENEPSFGKFETYRMEDNIYELLLSEQK